MQQTRAVNLRRGTKKIHDFIPKSVFCCIDAGICAIDLYTQQTIDVSTLSPSRKNLFDLRDYQNVGSVFVSL